MIYTIEEEIAVIIFLLILKWQVYGFGKNNNTSTSTSTSNSTSVINNDSAYNDIRSIVIKDDKLLETCIFLSMHNDPNGTILFHR